MPALKFEAIGTQWSIETSDELSEVVTQKIHERIELFDSTYSRFRKDSLATKLLNLGNYSFPEDAIPLLEFYRKLYDVTDGAVTPLIGETLEHAGYDATYSLKPKAGKVSIPKWDDAMIWTGSKVEIKKPIVLDVGAAGKGYLVDIIALLLEEQGIDEYVIDASGDICHRGKEPEHIGLENPHDQTRVLGVAQLQDASLCASASNRRKWGDKWHHIINAKTGEPANDVLATWVIADSTMVADGLATALFFVSFDALKEWKFQAVRLLANGHIEKTDNFVGELFL
jgi:thiamine biosynthesis lipoprotein